MSDVFFDALSKVTLTVNSFLSDPRFKTAFESEDLRDAVMAYVERSGKRLRPAVMMWCCGAVGGDPSIALPAGAGVELFHTWTLVHDDIIDNDDLRRGGPSVHCLGRELALTRHGYTTDQAELYGRDLAILTGDCQHAWSVSLFCECKVDPGVVLAVIRELETRVVNTLLEGELLDVQYSRAETANLTQDAVLKMLWMKTGALYEFCARAGAMIGLNTADRAHPQVAALAGFASECGTAFQLQDDILGLVGDHKKLGKPVGSDIREGKKTLPVLFALESASVGEKNMIESVLGDQNASDAQVSEATELVAKLGGIDRTRALADEWLGSALAKLDTVPDSPYKALLRGWADYMVNRSI